MLTLFAFVAMQQQASSEIIRVPSSVPLPKNGLIPNAETAIGIAEVVWKPIFGEALVKAERPFMAFLKKDRWIVTGTPLGANDPNASGGSLIMIIMKSDGRIVRVSHSK